MTKSSFLTFSILAIVFLISPHSHARFYSQINFSYLNYSDNSTSSGKMTRSFQKLFLGASINSDKNLIFGWNINSWSSAIKQASNDEETYSLTEMGPRLQYFFNDSLSFYTFLEWNPYARGSRKNNGENGDITGSSLGLGIGYRFRFTKKLGGGISLMYHNLSISNETIGSSESSRSDSISTFMPMLQISYVTK